MQLTITNGTLTQVQETLSASSGYSLPSSVTVTGATANYNSSTGVLILTSPTSTISIAAAGVPASAGSGNFFIGGASVSKMLIGNSEISKIFLGNFEIYSAGSEPIPEPEPELTDLTGTKWLINTTTCSAGYGQFELLFYYNDEEETYTRSLNIGYSVYFDDQDVNFNPTPNEVVTSDFITIHDGDTLKFTGGTDATNTDLIAWLQANATQVPANQVNLISFTISGTTYQAEEGMTWGEWIESEYNTNGFKVLGNSVYKADGSDHILNVTTSDEITSTTYSYATGGSNNGK